MCGRVKSGLDHGGAFFEGDSVPGMAIKPCKSYQIDEAET